MLDEESTEKRRRRRQAILVGLAWLTAIAALVGGIWIDLRYHWTGYSNFVSPLTTNQLIERQKTIWDWPVFNKRARNGHGVGVNTQLSSTYPV